MLTLSEALNALTIDDLKKFLPFMPTEKGGSRKAELVSRITNGLIGEKGEKLKAQYEQLDQWQKLAVAEVLYGSSMRYFKGEFKAKYQKLPDFYIKSEGKEQRYNRQPSRLQLFLFYSTSGSWSDRYLTLPKEFVPLLRQFVPKPKPVTLPSQETLPETDKNGAIFQVRLCMQEVLIDLPRTLNMVQQGKLKVSAKTGRATAATLKLITQSLNGGDFYELDRPKEHEWEAEIGSIKAFAWPMLLQAAKLAQVSGSKLELSRSAAKQISKPSEEVLRLLWLKWVKSTLLDEFSRIDEIKGQKSKGRVMTAVVPRRDAIVAALKQCDVDAWVEVDAFFNYIQAAKFNFDVTHNPWKLYLVDREYGALGYEGFHLWSIVQGRYVMCLLFEYAATLGMVDVAYVDPQQAQTDYQSNWGGDSLDFLSRYDGLRYFRLTALGAYCLGLVDTFEAPENVSDSRFSVLPSLHIKLLEGTLSSEDQLLLDTWASRETENSWKLDKVKAIVAIESGFNIDTLESFLKSKDSQLLPEAVESFIHVCRSQGAAIKQVAVSLLLECSSAAIAKTLAEHQETKQLCQRVGKKQLVIKQSQEEKFRQAARIVGFGMVL